MQERGKDVPVKKVVHNFGDLEVESVAQAFSTCAGLLLGATN